MWLMLMTLNGSANWGERETVKVHVEDWQKEKKRECVHMYVSVIILFSFSCLSPPPSLSLSFPLPLSLCRYYWNDDLFIRAVNAEFLYGYEYLGNTGRLVITPLTDRYCTVCTHITCAIMRFVFFQVLFDTDWCSSSKVWWSSCWPCGYWKNWDSKGKEGTC